jgi:formylglycine-generating enzyme required for sulfatase activity
VSVTLGSPDNEYLHQSDEALRSVRITRPLSMGVYPVTQRQWEIVGTRSKPSNWNNTTDWEERPVERVSYYDIRENPAGLSSNDVVVDWPANGHTVRTDSFMGRLRAKTGGLLAFDLPTEAQWEYACRAGTTGPWNNGLGSANNETDPNLALLGRYQKIGGFINGTVNPPANCFASNATAKVGSYLPNAWGLYDMHGNVWEWCLDYYTVDATILSGDDPVGPVLTVGSPRVLRGGSWDSGASYVRSARRLSFTPTTRFNITGLRVAAAAEVLGEVGEVH